jgi:redox-sensitive bicupin YhaK (pirin superfamily)
MFELRPAAERGNANFGHTFSFGHYHDPRQVGFSDLLVINDDLVAPGQGFGTHPHRDMEIFSYVLDGALAHEDSMGTGSVIRPGDVQMMSAGTGIRHSEFNASNSAPVHFLQIWIVPDRQGVEPRYQQRHFSAADKRGRLRLIISPDGADGSLGVPGRPRVCRPVRRRRAAHPRPAPGRHAYVHLAQGRLVVNGQPMQAGDGARLRNAERIEFSQGENAEVLVFDLRPNELPDF